MPVQLLFFYLFSSVLVFAALMVTISGNSVRCALFLVLAFVMSAALWIISEAEFLALILVLVYVGAVMTLFLFVVMMLNVDKDERAKKAVRYLPLGALTTVMVLMILMYAYGPEHLGMFNNFVPHSVDADYSNVKELGRVLYTHYVLAFEVAGVLLLVAIIAAISLAFRGKRPGTKFQVVDQQVRVKPTDRVRLVNMPSEKRGGA